MRSIVDKLIIFQWNHRDACFDHPGKDQTLTVSNPSDSLRTEMFVIPWGEGRSQNVASLEELNDFERLLSGILR